jgi:hypothetical protein
LDRDSARLVLAPERFEHYGITRLLHPLSAQDLSPAYFWPFNHIKAAPEGVFFWDNNEARIKLFNF